MTLVKLKKEAYLDKKLIIKMIDPTKTIFLLVF